MAHALKVVVKGVPEESKLGDCPFCHRTLLSLELKGLDYTKEYVDFKNKPAWLFEKNDKGTVPILNDGEKWIPDSDVIADYLEQTFPDTPLGASKVEGVAEKLFPSFVQFLKSTDADAAEKEAALLEQLEQLDKHLAAHGPFLNGEKMGAADAVVVPRLYHMFTALPYFKNYHVPDKYVNVWKYFTAAKGTEAFKKTDYGEDMIIKGWKDHGVSKKE